MGRKKAKQPRKKTNSGTKMTRRRFLKTTGIAVAGVGIAAMGMGGKANAALPKSSASADVTIFPSGEGNSGDAEVDSCSHMRVNPFGLVFPGDPVILYGTADVSELQAAVLGVDTSDNCSFWFLGRKYWYAVHPTQPVSEENPCILPSYNNNDNPNHENNYAGTRVIELDSNHGPFQMGFKYGGGLPSCFFPSVQVVIPRSLVLRGQRTGRYYDSSDYQEYGVDLSGKEKMTEMLDGFHNFSVFNFNPDSKSRLKVHIKDIVALGSMENLSGCAGWADVTYENLTVVNFNPSPAIYGAVAGDFVVKDCFIASEWPVGLLGFLPLPSGGNVLVENNELEVFVGGFTGFYPFEWKADSSSTIRLKGNLIHAGQFGVFVDPSCNAPVRISKNHILVEGIIEGGEPVNGLHGIFLLSGNNTAIDNVFEGKSLFEMLLDVGGDNTIKNNDFSGTEMGGFELKTDGSISYGCITLAGSNSTVTENALLGKKYFPKGTHMCNQVQDVNGTNRIVQWKALCSAESSPPEHVRDRIWEKIDERRMNVDQNLLLVKKNNIGFHK